MPDNDPHTAEIVDADPDRRLVPRPGSEGGAGPAPQSGSSCPPIRTAGHSDTPGQSAGNRGLTRAERSALEGALLTLDEVLCEREGLVGYVNRLTYVREAVARVLNEDQG